MPGWIDNVRQYSDREGRAIFSRFLASMGLIFLGLLVHKFTKDDPQLDWIVWPFVFGGAILLVGAHLVLPKDKKPGRATP